MTGERIDLRSKVVYQQSAVWLSDRPFAALCRLVAARFESADGFRSEPAVTIRRLRASFDLACGEGTGAKLIESQVGGRYRLTIEPGSIECVASLWRRLSAQKSLWRTLAALKRGPLKSD
jgi:hypothetical protein